MDLVPDVKVGVLPHPDERALARWSMARQLPGRTVVVKSKNALMRDIVETMMYEFSSTK